MDDIEFAPVHTSVASESTIDASCTTGAEEETPQQGGGFCSVLSLSRREQRGWCIVLTGFLVEALAVGGRSLFLIVMLLWEDKGGSNTMVALNWTRSELSWLMALVHICNGISTPLSGFLVDKFSPHLTITASIVFLACCYSLTSVIETKTQTWLVYGALTGTAFGCLNLNVFS